MNRSEHLAWCKKRALEYVDNNQILEAFRSMTLDLDDHEETRGHLAIEKVMSLMLSGHTFTQQEMRKFIEGFN